MVIRIDFDFFYYVVSRGIELSLDKGKGIFLLFV